MSFIASWQEKTRSTVFAGAVALVGIAGTQVTPANVAVVSEPARTASLTQPAADVTSSVTAAVGTFVEGMAKGDEAVVWTFASEEDQAAFGTETAIYDAYAEAFPELTDVTEINFGQVRQEGDTPFVPAIVRAEGGEAWVANFGLWKNDAGDWTLISLDIKPASDNSV